jgi:hypothetical protein
VEVTIMQNKTFKRFITWLLIANPLWWTSGCYTTREFTKIDEINTELKIVTKEDRVYTFTAWTYDSLKGISGDARWVIRSIFHSGDSEARNGRVTLRRDNIRSVTSEGEGNLSVDSLSTIRPKRGVEIEVTTKGNNVYIFKAWEPDGHGGISGEAKWIDPSSPSWSSDFLQGTTSLPRDSIRSVVTREINSGLTVLTVAGVTLGALCLILWAADPRWIPKGQSLIH